MDLDCELTSRHRPPALLRQAPGANFEPILAEPGLTGKVSGGGSCGWMVKSQDVEIWGRGGGGVHA